LASDAADKDLSIGSSEVIAVIAEVAVCHELFALQNVRWLVVQA